MASLAFIMDDLGDQPDDHRNKRSDTSPTASAHTGRETTTTARLTDVAGLASSSRRGAERSTSPPVSGASGGSTATTSTAFKNTSTSSLAPSSRQPPASRRSTGSRSPMDQAGYGSIGSSSSMAGSSNSTMNPMRPMGGPSGQDVPVKLTPITGRVSRARKGVPVHTCDICKPAKTFTRAEHLRRHQLSHQRPGFACSYPGCDRAFHRPDLLARHQQRHEQEGDKLTKTESEDGDPQLFEDRLPSLGIRSRSAHSPSNSGPGFSTTGQSANDMPTTPNASTGTPGYQQFAGSSRNASLSPQLTATGGHYRFSPRPSDELRYTSPGVSVVTTSPSLAPSIAGSTAFADIVDPYQPPRTTPSIYVVTQGLSAASHQVTDGGPPDLYRTEASPWTSSASDSTYSTPASDISRNPRYWAGRHRSPPADWPAAHLLSPYPGPTSRETPGSSTSLETMVTGPHNPMFMDAFSASSHFASDSQHFGAVLNVHLGSDGFSSAETSTNHLAMLSAAAAAESSRLGGHLYHSHHQQGISAAPFVRSPTPPTTTSISTTSHTTQALVTPVPGPLSINALARQKELAILTDRTPYVEGRDDSLALNMLADLGDSDTSGFLAALDLAMPAGGHGIPVGLDTKMELLPGAAQAAVPRLIEVYWTKFHVLYPIVHRTSVADGAGEPVLRCAMGAIATQYLDSREDRVMGSQLHEYAWQEVKRIPQWNLQVMQTILLCEIFARFRGRKAVTKPSKAFESLYSRVLYQDTAMLDAADLAAGQSLSIADRWHAWLDAEARRRLLTASFIVDVHSAAYQQQRRVAQPEDHEFVTPPIPLSDRSFALWNATSAEQWLAALSADPEAGAPIFVPPSESLTQDSIAARGPFDRAAILCNELLRLPPRNGQPNDSAGQFDTPSLPFISADSRAVLSVDDIDLDPMLKNPISNGINTSNSSSRSSFSGHHTPSHASLQASSAAEMRLAHLFIPTTPRAAAYLALRQTPLHDLLAVSGDSWIFSQKVLPATSFLEHQRRLRVWADGSASQQATDVSLASRSIATATVYAARGILSFLDSGKRRSRSHSSGSSPKRPTMHDPSDYWGLYVCALICWAFDHHHNRPSSTGTAAASTRRSNSWAGGTRRRHSGEGSSGARDQPSGSGGTSSAPTDGDEEAATMAWLRMVADTRPEELSHRPHSRRAAGGVVGLVRRRLEIDCIGGRSRLYVDAVGVLKKLEEGGNWKWF